MAKNRRTAMLGPLISTLFGQRGHDFDNRTVRFADIRGGEQRKRHLPLQRHGRHVAVRPLQPHTSCGHLHLGSPAVLAVHHHNHPDQLHPHDHAHNAHRRVHRVRIQLF
jgi:hypothetical protein